MTLEKAEGLTPEQLMEVRDKPLKESYESHHVAKNVLVARLEHEYGFHVVEHGDEAPHAEEVFYGSGPDLLVYEDDTEEQLCCAIEIKSKNDEKAEWYGRLNRRHYNDYVAKAADMDVPFFLYFCLVDMDCGAITREGLLEVQGEEIEGKVHEIEDGWVGFDNSNLEVIDEEEGISAVPASAITGVANKDEVVDGIPNVHGNDVVCLNEDKFRSLPWLLGRVSEKSLYPALERV